MPLNFVEISIFYHFFLLTFYFVTIINEGMCLLGTVLFVLDFTFIYLYKMFGREIFLFFFYSYDAMSGGSNMNFASALLTQSPNYFQAAND